MNNLEDQGLDDLVGALRNAPVDDTMLATVRASVMSTAFPSSAWWNAPYVKWLMVLALAVTVGNPGTDGGSPSIARAEKGVAQSIQLAASTRAELAVGAPMVVVQPVAARQPQRSADKPTAMNPPTALFQEIAEGPFLPPPAELPPSALLAEGMRLYSEEHWAEAADALMRVVEGSTPDSRMGVERAEFFLAKALYELELYHAAAAALDHATTRGEQSVYFQECLAWIAATSEHVIEPSRVSTAITRYRLDMLQTLSGRPGHDRVTYLAGRRAYDEARLDDALAAWSHLVRGSRWYVPAQFLIGIIQVRQRHARAALAAFGEAIDTLDNGDDGGVEDADRLRDLAWLSYGRLYYTLANRQARSGNSRDTQIDSRLLGNAIDAWDRIPIGSEYWLDAMFEQSWALFLADQDDRVLGRIHALLSPYFDARYNPEALVLRGVVLFHHCDIGGAQAAVTDFHHRYDRFATELANAQAQWADHTQAFELLRALRARRATFPPEVLAVLRTALEDRELLQGLEANRALLEEEHRAQSALSSQEAVLGWVLQELAVDRALLIDHTGEMVGNRLTALSEHLHARTNEIDSLQVEIYRTLREQSGGRMPDPARNPIVADQEHQLWPFDGEYWRDELPYYRQAISSRCDRGGV